MVHKFDPAYANGSVFSFVDWSTLGNHLDCQRANQPIPASYFPKSLTVDKAVQPLPDMFHASRDIIVFSERARALMEELALGQVEFIPVTIHATTSKIGYRLQLASAYYFTNVLGRAQRFQWLGMPVRVPRISRDGIQRVVVINDCKQWKVRPRLPNEPLIWHDVCWQFDDKYYVSHSHILVEDALWEALDAAFRGQLNRLRVGK